MFKPETSTKPEVTVSDLMIYPIKSVRRVKLKSAAVGRRGFHYDRRWMLIDPDGRFISQRKHPRMALIRALQEGSTLKVSAPEMSSITVSQPEDNTDEVLATVWNDECKALDPGDKAAQWFSDFLRLSCRLVYMPDSTVRQVSQKYGDEGDITSFADGFPFLLISEASLKDLNSRLYAPVTMANFRPNIVLTGTDAYEEDTWKKIRVGQVVFKVVKACTRCIMTTVDPETGKKNSKEPLYTLSKYRKTESGVIFGQNLIPQNQGAINLGDKVEILE